VLEIRGIYKDKTPNFWTIGEKYGVSHHTIRDVVKRKSWKHVK